MSWRSHPTTIILQDCKSAALGDSLRGSNPLTIKPVTTPVCDPNLKRKEIIIANTGDIDVFIALAMGATVDTYAIRLEPGDSWISDIWQGSIQAVTAGSYGQVCVTELV